MIWSVGRSLFVPEFKIFWRYKMKYRIFVSDTESPENVKEFCVESEKPVEEIVKAAALQEV